jgi:hypothetical protein
MRPGHYTRGPDPLGSAALVNEDRREAVLGAFARWTIGQGRCTADRSYDRTSAGPAGAGPALGRTGRRGRLRQVPVGPTAPNSDVWTPSV